MGYVQHRLARRRGVAMLITVLLVAVAASIAFAIVRQALLESRSVGGQLAANAAEDQARSALARVQGALDAQPTLFTTTVLGGGDVSNPAGVLPDEAPRLCLAGDAAGAVFEPGSAWPASCGMQWQYVPAEPDWTGTRLEIYPPSPADPGLRVAVRVVTDNAESVLVGRFVARGANRFTVLSTGELDVADASPSASVAVQGALYATSLTGVDSETTAVTITGPASGEVFDSVPAEREATSWWSASPDLGPPQVRNVRDLLFRPAVNGMFTGSAAVLREIGCRGTPGTNLGPVSAELCLQAGATLIDAEGNAVVVPVETQSYALVVEGNRVRVWTSPRDMDTSPTSPLLCDPLPGCSLPDHASGLMGTGDHPGALSWWQDGELGEFLLPAGGVLAADRAVSFGVCSDDDAQYANAQPCVAWESSEPGMQMSRSLSVVAPVIVAGSPVTAVAGAQLALVADGAVVLPYWARPAAGTLRLDAHLLGGATDGGVVAFPRTWDGAPNADNEAASLVLNGSVNGPSLTLGHTGYAAVTYGETAAGVAGGPPWFNAAGVGWSLVSITRSANSQLAFDPRAVGGLRLWLDAGAPDSISATGDQQVLSWADRSGNGLNFGTGDPANRPTVVLPSEQERRLVVLFDGDDVLTNVSSNWGFMHDSATTTFVVVRDLRVDRQASGLLSTGGQPGWALGFDGDDAVNSVANDSGLVVDNRASGAMVADQWQIVQVTTDPRAVDAAQRSRLTVTGGQPAVVASANELTGTAATGGPAWPLQLGASGPGTTGGSFMLVAEVLVFDRVLTEAEVQRVNDYLSTKWQIATP